MKDQEKINKQILIAERELAALDAKRKALQDRIIKLKSSNQTIADEQLPFDRLGEPVEIVFHRNQKPMEQNHIRRVFKRVLKKAGIREMRLHDIRHTFASLLLSQNESPVYVKEQLGHSSIQMTVDIYGHLIPSSNRGAVNRLDSTQPSATYPQPAKIERP